MSAQDKTAADFKSGFVAIAGPPNAGKSTLLNRMLGEKIAITSKKPQTTRNRILGVLHRPGAQLIFIDTPGVHQPKGKLNVRLVDTALSALGEADLVLAVVDASRTDSTAEFFLVKRLQQQKKPAILALNKIDRVEKAGLLEIIDRWAKAYPFKAVVPISAKKGTQVDALVAAMESLLPPGPPFFPEDTLTDLPERFFVAEIIREKVFRFTGDEIPYATAVTVDTFKVQPGGRPVNIEATINLERESQKAIVIGKHGSKLKRIGTEARREIENFLQARVYLKLFVRVQKNWRRDPRAIRRFGY